MVPHTQKKLSATGDITFVPSHITPKSLSSKSFSFPLSLSSSPDSSSSISSSPSSIDYISIFIIFPLHFTIIKPKI